MIVDVEPFVQQVLECAVRDAGKGGYEAAIEVRHALPHSGTWSGSRQACGSSTACPGQLALSVHGKRQVVSSGHLQRRREQRLRNRKRALTGWCDELKSCLL